MIRIGIVGCGRILAAHLQGYQRLRDAGFDTFRITALCARREADARMYLERGAGPAQRRPVSSARGDPLAVGDVYLSDFQDDVSPQVYTDYRTMIEQGPVDAVNDFTTHALHHQVGDVALQAGKHLLTQKPLAVSVAAARRMCRLAERAGVVLGVFENARYRPETRQLRWLFDSGRLGTPQLVLMANVGHWWAPDRIVANTPWRHQRLEGGGITLDIGVHLFHQLRYLLGDLLQLGGSAPVVERERVERADDGRLVQTVTCDADDTMLAHFAAGCGATGQLAASWCGRGRGLRFGEGRGLVYYASAGQVLDDRVTFDDGTTDSLAELFHEHCPLALRDRWFPRQLDDSFALCQLDWLAAIQDGRDPETDGPTGLADLATAYALLEAHHAGRDIAVADVLSGAVRGYQQPIDERFGLLDE